MITKSSTPQLICIALSSLFLSQCQTAPVAVTPSVVLSPAATTVSSPPPQTPLPISTEADFDFQTRQFDPATLLFETRPYPDELTLFNETDLVRMRCSPEYFSWSGAEHEYFDPTTQQRHPITDRQLLSYLKSAQDLNPGKSIRSIAYCEIENGKSLVIYRVGPCGGGCVGIPNFSYGATDGSLELIALIQVGEDGAYFGCSPLQLTKSEVLYITCLGEGTGIIRKIDLRTQSVSVILRCEISKYSVRCQSN